MLVYRTIGLGDFLTGVPAYRAVRRAFPDAELVLAAPEPLRPLADLTGVVDTFLPTAELAVPQWQAEPPDVAVNLHGTGPASHRAILALRPLSLVAFACPDAGVDGATWRPDEHEVARWCRLLAESGIPSDPTDLALRLPAAPESRHTTVVHPGAADPARRWPPDRFAAVARALTEDGHDVVVTGSAAEASLSRSVAEHAGLPSDQVLAGRLDLGELAQLVAGARLVISGDTGVAHLATALDTPSVVLFGPVPPAQWGPPPERTQHRVLWRPELADLPVPRAGPHPALAALDAADVLGAIAELEASGAVSSGGGAALR